MPSVASKAHSVPPSRPHPANARNPSDGNAKPSASPFTEMLDSAAPTEPAPRHVRSERPEQADRAGKPASPKPVEHQSDDTRPAKGIAGVTDTAGVKGRTTVDGSDDTKTANASKVGDAVEAGTDATAEAVSADGKPEPGGEHQPDLDLTAALDTIVVDAKPAAPAPPAAVVPTLPLSAAAVQAGTPNAAPAPDETLSAASEAGPKPDKNLNASIDAAPKPVQGERVTAQPAPKSAAAPSLVQDDQQGAASIKAAAPADPGAAVAQTGPAQDGQLRGGDDKGAAELHRELAGRAARLGAPEAPAPGSSDAAGAAKAPADAVSNAGVLAPANAPQSAAAAAGPTQAHAQADATAVPLPGLAVAIASHANAGKSHFEIRLDPPELGRIDVKLDVDRDGNVSTRLVVDRSDTLDLLKRDAASLERALQQAGLKTSDHGLDFSLRQHAFAEREAAAPAGARVVMPDDDTAPLEALRQGYGRLLGLGGGLDIRV